MGGCVSSKLYNEEIVERCLARKNFMKEAVVHRHEFAAAHMAYLQSLRDTGASLRQFAEGESHDSSSATAATPPLLPSSKASHFLEPPPPPPPLDDDDNDDDNNNEEDYYQDCVEEETVVDLFPSSSSPSSFSSFAPLSSSGSLPSFAPPPPPSPPQSSPWDFYNPFTPPTPPTHLQEHRKQATQMSVPSRNNGDDNNITYLPELEDEEDNEAGQRKNGWALAKTSETEAKKGGGQKEEANELAKKKKKKGQNSHRGGGSTALVVTVSSGQDIMEIMKHLDTQFLAASTAGKEVSRVLETQKAHYTAKFPDRKRRRSYNSSSARVFSALTWNWTKSLASKDEIEKNTIYEVDGVVSHALTLERLYAWEKKLYGEVKAGEEMRGEHQRKCSLLRSQEARGEDSSAIDKTRAKIKRLHSLILVSFQGVGSTTAAIQSIRDDELYPQLVDFIEALVNMWRSMHVCHVQQKQFVINIRHFDSVVGQEATSEFHHHATVQLEKELRGWYQHFCSLVHSHREYMSAINGWLHLNLIQIETDLQQDDENCNNNNDEESLKNFPVSKIFSLCEEWQRTLDRLPEKVASEALKSLVAVLHAVVRQQALELRQKRKVENMTKKLDKKLHSLQSMMEKNDPPPFLPPRCSSRPRRNGSFSVWSEEDREEDDEEEEDQLAITPIVKNPLQEKKVAVDAYKKKLERERAKYLKCIQDTRILTLNNLQTGLPGVFEAMTGFSSVYSQALEGVCNLVKSCY